MLINKKNLDNKAFFIFTDSVYTSSVLCLFNKKKPSKHVTLSFSLYACLQIWSNNDILFFAMNKMKT